MGQLGPNIAKVLEEQEEMMDPSLAGMINEQDAVNALIDGAMMVILQKVAMATMVAQSSAMTQGKHVDLSKVQQGRVKMVEGLLLILDAESDIVEFMDEDELFGGVEIADVLHEFIAYNQPATEPEDTSNE